MAGSPKQPKTPLTAPRAVATGPATPIVYSYYDILLLRLTDLFLWTSPQLTVGIMALFCLAGTLTHRDNPHLTSWAGVLFVALCVALPLTTVQRRRRDVPTDAQRRSAGGGGTRKKGLIFTDLRDDDQYRLDVIARGMTRVHAALSGPLGLAPEGPETRDDTSGGERASGSAAESSLFAFIRSHVALLAVVTAVVVGVSELPGTISVSHLLDSCIAELCVLTLLVTGLAIAVVEPLRAAAAYRARTAAQRSQEPQKKQQHDVAVEGEDDDATLVVSPQHVVQALRLRRLAAHPHLRGVGAPARYALPTLNEREAAALEQLLNFGAPFSTILLRPLRLWNARCVSSIGGVGSPRHSRNPSAQVGSLSDVGLAGGGASDGWRVLWERDGLRCEVKDTPAPVASGSETSAVSTPSLPASPPSVKTVVTAMRMIVNVPHANVGSLQAILLDDPDGAVDATKSTFAYAWDPLLVQRRVVKPLSYDVSVVRTVSRSAVHGVPMTETTQIVSSAVLLDYEQQNALKVYRPFGHRRPGKKLVSSATRGLRVFLSCGIPCPAALRESAPSLPSTRAVDSTSLTIGLEEVDGSLSLGILLSLDNAHHATQFPPEWLDVLQRDTAHRIERLAALVSQVGPQENEVAVYKNERGFQPLLLRQAFSERVKPQSVAAASMAATVAATASVDWMEKRRKSTHFASDGGLDGSPSDAALSPSSGDQGVASGANFSPTDLRFVSDLIASATWRPVKARAGVQVFTAVEPPVAGEVRAGSDENAEKQTRRRELAAVRAVKVRVFLPRATLPIVDDVLRRSELSRVYDPFVEQRVTVTVLQAAELLARAVPDLVDGDDGDEAVASEMATNTSATASGVDNDGARDASPSTTTSLVEVAAKLAKERGRGRTVQWLRYRPPALGGLGVLLLRPRDYVVSATTGEYFLAKDLFSTERATAQLGAAAVKQLPDVYRRLPPRTRMFLRCGEDASGILPPLEGVYRGHVRLSGVMCWETTAGEALKAMALSDAEKGGKTVIGEQLAEEDIDPQEKGVMLVRCFVTEPGGWLPTWLWNRSLHDELDNAVQLRRLVAGAVADNSVV